MPKLEVQFKTLFENLPDLVLIVDRAGFIRLANREVFETSGEVPETPPPDVPRGATPAQLAGSASGSFLSGVSAVRAREALRRALASGQAQSVELVDVFGLCWAARIVPILEGALIGHAMVICQDVTNEKKAQAEVEAEQTLLRQLIDLHERERQLIAYEIHDGFAQQLTGALFNLQAYHQMLERNPEAARSSFQQAVEILTDSVSEARRLISGLRPPVLDESGIVMALEYLVCERSGGQAPDVELVHDVSFERLAPPLESAIFRIVQEGVGNARRHSRSDKVRVEFLEREGRVLLEIRDWGVGFEPAAVDPGHFGLESIRQRARLLGGRATIHSVPGSGTQIAVELPLILPAAEARSEQAQECWDVGARE